MSPLGPQTMVERLELVAVKPPSAALAHAPAGEWRDLGWHAPIDPEAAERDHGRFVSILRSVGAEVIVVGPDERTGLDSIYAHDCALTTPDGVVPLVPGKTRRAAEGAAMASALAAAGVPVLDGFTDLAATADGGDFSWVDAGTLVVGRSHRTNSAGIAEIRRIVEAQGVEVVAVDLPNWHGPAEVLHLQSFFSMIDRDLAVVYPELLPLGLVEVLADRGIAWVEVPAEEFPTQGCNVLALSPRNVVTPAGNPVTKARMEAMGATVATYDGTEISLKGDGGPTCLTRPLRRHEG